MRIAIDPTIARLLRDVCAGIRVLQSRDGVDLSESQIVERGRNIVMGLVGNYRIEAVDLSPEGRDEGRAQGRDEGRSRARRDHQGRDAEPITDAYPESASMMEAG